MNSIDIEKEIMAIKRIIEGVHKINEGIKLMREAGNEESADLIDKYYASLNSIDDWNCIVSELELKVNDG